MNNVLIVSFHFPPQIASSGFLRALKFSRYLPEHGWRPTVLTANQRAYEFHDPRQLSIVPRDLRVIRTFALDTTRHLSFRRRYLHCLALPDRWISWCLGAVPAGLYTVRARNIDVILTTFPIATAVLIGLLLHRLTAKPWVIDFRDSMTEDDYPRDPRTRKIYQWLERQAMRHGSLFVFTAESARQMYLDRYPSLSPDHCVVIHNGYDEEDFAGLRTQRPMDSARAPLRLLHSGLIYFQERNPMPFFRALSRLKQEGRITPKMLQVDLRAAGPFAEFIPLLRDFGIDDMVHPLPILSYKDALQDTADADALLLLQAASCNHQIPAKIYEYLRMGKPILALTAAAGDTARLLRSAGGATIVDLEEEASICRALPEFVAAVAAGTHPVPNPQEVPKYTRRNQAKELAACLQRLIARSSS